MDDFRWAQIAPLTGVGFVLLLAAGVLTINYYAYLPSAEEVTAFYEANATGVTIGAYLIVLSSVALIWFAGSLRSALRTAEGGTGRLSAVAFGGGIAAAAGLMVAMSAILSISERARIEGAIPGDAAMMLYDLSGNLFGFMLAPAIGVMIAASTVIAYRTGFLPCWSVWVGGLIAIGSPRLLVMGRGGRHRVDCGDEHRALLKRKAARSDLSHGPGEVTSGSGGAPAASVSARPIGSCDMETLSDTDHADAVSSSGRPTTRVHLSLALSLVGLMMITLGLAIDFVLHANDPSLAADEGLFTLANPGHLMLGIGIAATAAGLGLAAWSMIPSGGEGSRILGLSGIAAALGVIALVGALAYVASGPGFGHDHGASASTADSASGNQADQSRLPRDQGLALAALAWSGSSSLVGGIEHDHGDGASSLDDLAPAERESLDAEFEVASSVVRKYMSVERAIADGYTATSPRVDGVGIHYTKWTLVDRPFDLDSPSQLLYDEVKFGEGLELVALSYWVASEHPPEGFAGDADAWHQHRGTCFENGFLVDEGVPDRDSCAGDWVNGERLWMLHAWIVPGMDNPRGVFAAANQRICERICGAEN